MSSPLSEPAATAALFAVVGGLFGASALLSRISQRLRIPLVLVFLVLGVLAGSEGIGHIPFDDYAFAFRAGSAALVLILFDGGLNTSVSSIRRVAAPAAVLATVGVVATAGLVAAFAHLLGLAWPSALLLGAVVSSTDAAAVFSVLRNSNTRIDHRLSTTLEVESGINDPMAMILTVVLTENLLAPAGLNGWRVAATASTHIVIGGAIGFGIGVGARWVLSRVRLPASGLYPVFTLAIAFLAFALPTLLHGSGFLGVYVAAVVLGSGSLPYRGTLLGAHDGLAWLSQVAMFLMLGMLVFPSQLWPQAGHGVLLAIGLAVVARPLVVMLCLAPFGFRFRESFYLGWVGLRGAVPIILATYPVVTGAPGAEPLFHLVFFIVVVNAIIPGVTVPWMTRRLDLESDDPPPALAVLQIESRSKLEGELLSFYIDDALSVSGVSLAELEIPVDAAVTMIVRGRRLIAPRAETRLEEGDHVYVVTNAAARPYVQLLFGRPESSD